MRRCLIVSPYFPPSTLAGVHRARHLAKYLPAHGWEPTVLCVDPAQHVEELDAGLRALVPVTAKVVETDAIPSRLTAPFGIRGDIGLRGFFHLRAALAREIKLARPKVVLITGAPFFPMLLSKWITRRFETPVVLDFQDPWASNEGATRARWTKGWIAHRLALRLEPLALSGASWVTSVSERQNAELAWRYPWLDAARMSSIPIGGDTADYEYMRKAASPSLIATSRLITFTYVGTALPRSEPLLTALFQGLFRLRTLRPGLSERVHLRFVGTSNQPGTVTKFRVMPVAQAAGVANQVSEEPARVPFLEALRILATTHAVLMIGSDEPHYTASKIYPAMMSGRPFLSIFHEASSAYAILSKTCGGAAIGWAETSVAAELADQVAQALATLASSPASFPPVDPSNYAAFSADAIAGQYAEIFERISN